MENNVKQSQFSKMLTNLSQISFDYTSLDPEWQQRAEEELQETPEKFKQELAALKCLAISDTNFSVPNEDAFLLRFLRARKFDRKKAFAMYYLMKLKCPELFQCPLPSEIEHVFELQAQTMLKERDRFGRRVYILRVGNNKLEKLRTDDTYLLRFLHCSKFDVEQAYKRMEMFYELLIEFPEWFHIATPMEKKNILYKNMKIMLNGRDRGLRSIYVCKVGNVNPSQVTLKDVLIIDDMWLEMVLDDPMLQCRGLCAIVDIAGYSWKLFQWLTPSNLKFANRKIDALPFVDIIIHVVNTSFLLNASVKIIWPFLNEKLKQSIYFHNKDWASLHKHIDPKVLPPEYGGTANISYEKLFENLVERSNEFMEKTKYIKLIVSSK